MRSELGWRSRFKPHGYSGDFRLMELFYDLEMSAGRRMGRTAGENLMDHVIAHSDGVRLIRERARRLEATLVALGQDRSSEPRVLDVGGGGARYIRRALERLDLPYPTITIFDQDLAVPQFWAHETPPEISAAVRVVSRPVKEIFAFQPDQPFDLVLSSGLYDYLDQTTAQALTSRLWDLTAPGGSLIIANIMDTESTVARFFRQVLMDWRLVNRSDAQMQCLLSGVQPSDYISIPEFDLGIVQYDKPAA